MNKNLPPNSLEAPPSSQEKEFQKFLEEIEQYLRAGISGINKEKENPRQRWISKRELMEKLKYFFGESEDSVRKKRMGDFNRHQASASEDVRAALVGPITFKDRRQETLGLFSDWLEDEVGLEATAVFIKPISDRSLEIELEKIKAEKIAALSDKGPHSFEFSDLVSDSEDDKEPDQII